MKNQGGSLNNNYRHGKRGTKEYIAWVNMRQRCDNEKLKQYKDYGGRGITYDPLWSEFDFFFADMGTAPTLEHTLDRKDNNLGYFKDNCRWATQLEQQNNRRPRNGAYASTPRS